MISPPPPFWTLTARWVFPVDRPPLPGGTVTIAGDRIAAIEPHGARTADVDLGNAAVLPGLVNAHTHLDLTGLRGKCPPSPDFTGWLRQVIAHRQATTPEQAEADIRAGLAECRRFGTTCLGDISAQGGSVHPLAWAPLRSIVFLELLGLTPDRARQAWEKAVYWNHFGIDSGLYEGPPYTVGQSGLSPHAPYSVRAVLFRRVASRARHLGCPVAIHLAETAAELELLEHHRGPFVKFLSELGAWAADGLIAGPDELLKCYSGTNPVLFVHCNYLAADAAVPPNGTVVYCPRTHAAFGHPPHPFREFLARGVRVALGTDSLASNPDLSVLEEARFLHAKYPDLPAETLLRMATLSGAEALGWHDETGSLTPGKSADLVVVPLPPDDDPDPHRLLLRPGAPVQAVLFRGVWIRRTGFYPVAGPRMTG